MFDSKLYKPSNKFSVVGLVLMFLSMLAAGMIMSWLYLVITAAIPLIYLNILLAVGVSAGLGVIGGLFVKIYKIRAPILALVISLIALILVNYAKWAIYVGRDYDKYIYDDLRDTKVSEMYEQVSGYLEGITGKPVNTLSEEDAKGLLVKMEAAKSVNIKQQLTQTMSLFGDDKETQKALSAITMLTNVLGDTLGDMMENLLGTSPDEIVASFEKLKSSSSMNMYEYLYDYRGMQARTGIWLMSHPGELFSDIKNINSVGRWTIKSHRYGLGDSQSDNVSGFVLWVVWIAELCVLIIPALLMIKDKAKYPFIESEDEWAVEDKPMPQFMFSDMLISHGASTEMVKSNIMRDPEFVFTMPIVTVTQAIPEKYYQITFCRSRYYDEVYITVKYSQLTNPRKNQRKNTVLISNLRVDADFLATLYGIFKYEVPPLCHGVNKAEEVQKENEQRANDERPKAPTPPKMTGAEAIFDQPLYTRPEPKPKPQPQETSFAEQQLMQEQQAARPTSGDMDGIDTSSLDLDHFDFK